MISAVTVPAQEENPAQDSPASNVPEVTDKTSRKIIDLHLRARGGRENLGELAVVNIKAEFTENYKDYKLEILLQAPDLIRVTSTLTHMGDDYVTVSASDGTVSWKQETIPERKNPKRVTGLDKQLLELEAMLPFLFLDHSANGHVFAYRGQDTYAKRDVYVLHGWLANGLELDILIDAKSFHIINYRHPYRIAGTVVDVDRAPAGLFRLQETWWEKGYVYRYEGKSFRKIVYKSISRGSQPDADAFTEPPIRERWLKIKR